MLAPKKISASDSVVELQTNLDDVSGEVLAHAATAAMSAGAVDAWIVPVQMKKGRPGVVLHALVRQEEESAVAKSIFEETGTLGIRRAVVSRYVAERGVVKVDVGGTVVAVKWGRWEGRLISVAPEYEDCAKAASAAGMTLKEASRLAAETATQELRSVTDE